MNEPFAKVSMDLVVPEEKIKGQTMLLMQEYKPVVEQAMKEITYDFHVNQEFKEEFKKAVKDKIIEILKQEIIKSAQETAQKIISEQCKENNINFLIQKILGNEN